MTPERWQRIKDVLAGALDQPNEQSRAAFLSSACAEDTALQREVQSLLDQPPDEFDSVAETIGLVNVDPFSSGSAGRRMGAYELVRELGRGGMGTVWLARRADQHFEKLVAIKLLKRGTDTDEVLSRFQAERQILARLDHPNIARLLDAGTTDDGLPYFVMEYVDGARLTDFVREEKLSLGERLRLFLKICGAVQFAHQNLVVHRDLKPGNILVTPECEPKLLDFGVAKLLAAGDDAWQMTMAGRERFTPGYASPEQVRGEPITTVSDVYSLGALLYEMLTDIAPHRFPTSTPTALQIEHVVCEEETARPSTVALDHEMRRQLRGDLDTIVLRALAKVPERRYRGAGHFADDLRRYLENKPVHARPDTVGYRAGKFLRRNKKAAIAAGLILLSLGVGGVATLRQAQIANRERARAVRRFNQVRRIANSFMIEFHNLIAELPGSLAARQLVTQKAVDYLDSLAQEAGDDLTLQSELAQAYDKIGDVTFNVQQSIATHGKALSLNEALVRAAPANSSYRRQLSESYDKMADSMKIAGHSARAIAYARKSLDMMQSVAGSDPANQDVQHALADCRIGLAIAMSDAGDFQGALENGRLALQAYQKLAAQNPDDKFAERDLESALRQVATDELDAGEFEHAMTHAREAFVITQRMFEAEPSNSRHRRDMWATHFQLGECFSAQGDPSAARDHYQKAIELMEALAAADPKDSGHRRWLALTYSSMGGALAALGQSQEAFSFQERAKAMSEKLAAEDESRVEVQRDLVKINQALGSISLTSGQVEQASSYFQQARSLAEHLLVLDPENARIRAALVEAIAGLDKCQRN
ncbi:MAG: protein kinase domain-containing protein [Chthoniobacterales bacterium]